MSAGPALRLALEVWTWRHGALWWFSGATLALAAAIELGVTRPQHLRADEARAARAALPMLPALPPAPASAPVAPVARLEGDARTLAELRATLADSPRAEALLRDWAGLARKHGVRWLHSDFTQQVDPHTGVLRVRVTLPLRGSYPAIRGFAEAVLRQTPSVSLDQVDFQRRSSLAPEPDARLVFSVWSEAPRAVAADDRRRP